MSRHLKDILEHNRVAWDKLGEAQGDLERLAGDYTTHAGLPDP